MSSVLLFFPLCRRLLAGYLPVLVLAVCFVTARAPAAAQDEEGIFIFPREYWRMEGDQRVVGAGGRLQTLETPEGESFEVVQYTPSREEQRRGDIELFNTAAVSKEKPQMLKRPLELWKNGSFAAGTYEQADVAVRSVFRRGSTAYLAHVGGLYEAAQLEQRLLAMQWLAAQGQGQAGLAPELVEQANRVKSYTVAAETLYRRERLRDYLDLLLVELREVPEALPQRITALLAQVPAQETRLAELQQQIATYEQRMGERVFHKQHPDWRAKELARLDAYEAKAEIDFLQKQALLLRQRGGRVLLAAQQVLDPEAVKDAEVTLLDAQSPPDVAPLIAQIQAKREALQASLEQASTPAELILQTATALDAAFAAVAADAAVVRTYKGAFPAGFAAALQAELGTLATAIQDLRVVDYGSYQVTMVSQMQGIENCLGTPIVVQAGGQSRTFWPLDYPGSGQFCELSFVVDFREPEAYILTQMTPRPAGAIVGYISSYDQYNALRMRGYEFSGSSTESRLRDAVFAPDAKAPWLLWDALQAQRQAQNGTFDISVTLQATRRRQRGMAGPDASIDALLLDAFIVDRVAEPPILLRQTVLQKQWFKPGEDQKAMAWLHNRTDREQTGRLRTVWVTDLATEQVMDERVVTLPAHSAARVVVDVDLPDAPPLWGQDIRMELDVEGHATQAKREAFSVHPNTFAVMMIGGHLGYDPYRVTTFMQNHVETFSSTFCDSVYVLPDDLLAPYLRSMSDVLGHVLQSRAEAQRNDKLGVASVHYIFPGCTGHKAYEMYKLHPEWFTSRLGWTEAMDANHRHVAEVGRRAFYEDAHQEAQEVMGAKNPTPLLHLEQTVNMANDDLYNNLVEDLITFASAVGWDGARWDGGPFMVFPKDVLGRDVLSPITGKPMTTQADLRAVAALRMRDMKQRLRAVHPDWVYGSNGDSFGYGSLLLTLDRDPPPLSEYPMYSEFMADGGSYMDEGWMNAYIYADNRNKATDYLLLALKQSREMKKAGGYLQTFSPQRDGAGHMNVDHIYYTLLPHIAGASYYGKLSGSPWSSDGPIDFFVRFSGLFKPTDLRALPDAAARVMVDLPDVWAPECTNIQEISPDHVRIILPIVNKFPRERIYDSQSRYSVMPRYVDQSFGVTVQAPDGYADVAPTVYELHCEPQTAVTRLDPRQDGDRCSVTLDGLGLFKVLVLDYRRNN